MSISSAACRVHLIYRNNNNNNIKNENNNNDNTNPEV